MQNQKEMLGSAPVGRLLFRLALPTVVAQLINMLYNIVDRIYIGHMPQNGELALTGVGVCMPIIMLVSAFAALVGSGGAPRASIMMGKQDMESAERTLGACFGLQLVVSVVLTAVLALFGRDLLLAFGASANTIEYAYGYLQIYALGTVFVQLTLGMNAFVTAQGFTRVSMLSVLIGAAANIVLDPVFIYVLGMGVRGAALATILSQALSCAWVVCFLCGKRTLLRLRPKHFLASPRIILPCLALGSASFIMQASESVISVCFNSSLLRYGGDLAVGAMTILSSIMQFAMLPMQGIAQGAQPILSYNYGAQNATRVKKTFKLLLVTCLCYSALLWSAIMLFPRAFALLFTTDTALLDFTERMIRVYFGGLVIFGIQIACQMTFVSLGNALSSVLVAVMRKFVLLLPLIYTVPHVVGNPVFGVYLAEPIADVIAVAFTTVLFVFQFRRALRRIERKEHSNDSRMV
ncbi:MAG: MATE family efflux transporter [Clostridia bacterium]|nr:MATE family efflux transporter [Clostridia bacterium]